MLHHRSVCEVQWEAEFFTLQDNNNKLVAALQEANTNVEQWKKQLAAYQEETEALRIRVSGAGPLREEGPAFCCRLPPQSHTYTGDVIRT